MGDRYIPRPPRDAQRPRYTHGDDYDPYGRYDRNERPDRDRYDRYGGYDEYERYRSPPPRSPPGRGGDRYGMQDAGYTFRGAAARDDRRGPSDQFSFRAPGPRFPSPDRYAPPPPPRAPQRDHRGGHPRRGNARGGPQRQPWRPKPPSSRNILFETGRASTPEQLEGMNADGQVRFNALESSSEESEDDHEARPTSSSEEEGEIRRKRFKVDAPPPRPDVPKWSNPDPYSVLPPTETIGAPKKDIVQVIRKAKNDIAPRPDMTQSVAQNDDFISFSFDDDMTDDKASIGQNEGSRDQSPDQLSMMAPVPNGPRHVTGSQATNGDRVPSLELKRPTRGNDAPSTRPPPIDLTGDSDDDNPPPPPPPRGFIMPTDEELMQQYVGQPKGKKRKHEEQSRGKGDVTEAWQANWTDPTPWCTDDRPQTTDVSVRLHDEITDFFDFVRPHQHEETIRQDLIERVQKAVRSMNGEARNIDIKCFGSFAAGLYLPTADMDLVAVSKNFMNYGHRTFCQSPSKLHKLVAHLLRTGIAQDGTTSAVTRAKVPIVKFTDKQTGIKVDISFENDSGLMANRTFQDWKVQFPTMPVIVVLIKQMLAMRDLNEVFTGGLGGFSIICLVVSMLQLMRDDEFYDMPSDRIYGDLLLNFLDLYGNRFNLRSTGILMHPPGYYDKIANPRLSQNANNLTIIDPNDPSNDISGGSREVHAVFEVFRKAHSQIRRRMEKIQSGKEAQESILECVLGGNYSSFIRQRNRLHKLYSGDSVSPPPEPVGNGQPQPQKRKRAKPMNQGPPNKQLRSNDGRAKAPPGGPLSDRIQGGPPVNKGGSSGPSASKRKSKTEEVGDHTRAKQLKRAQPRLASVIPNKMTKTELKAFKRQHRLS